MDEEQSQQDMQNYQQNNNPQKDKSGIDLAVLLLGIFSFIFPPLNIIGIITYFFSNKSNAKTIIGLTLSIISLILTILTIIFVVQFVLPSYNAMNEIQENRPYLELNSNFRGEPTQSQVSSTSNSVLISFSYLGNDRITLDINDSSKITTDDSSCEISFVRNSDTAGAMGESQFGIEGDEREEIMFLRGHVGIVEFTCEDSLSLQEGEMLEGEVLIVAKSARTNVPIKSLGDFKLKIN